MMENISIARYLTYLEINCGRTSGFNPVLTQATTVYLIHDPVVGQIRPFVVPVTQILDPFGEVNFHSANYNFPSYRTPQLPSVPQLLALPPPQTATE